MSSSRLRIAVYHNLPSGGGKRALYDQVSGLARRGHQIEAWCASMADSSFLPLSPIVPEHVIEVRESEAERSGRWAWTTKPYRDAIASVEEMDRVAAQASEEIRRGGFDVLFSGPCYVQSSPAIGRFVDIPSVLYLPEPNRDLYEARYDVDGGPQLRWAHQHSRRCGGSRFGKIGDLKFSLEMMRFDYSHLKAERLRVQVERSNALAFDSILTNSFFSRESIIRAYGLESRVCYLGVDTDRFRPSDSPKEPFVVGLGGLYPAKRPDLAIRAIGSIEPAQRPPLVWVGNMAVADYVAELTTLAKELEVEFRPMVRIDEDALVDLLGRAAVIVYTPRLEPFGFAPLEANACGTPVVAMAEGGIRETIRDGINGTLVIDPDPELIGRALLEYTSDLGLSARTGRLAREEIEKRWSLEASIDRLESELMRIMEGSPPSSGRRASGS